MPDPIPPGFIPDSSVPPKKKAAPRKRSAAIKPMAERKPARTAQEDKEAAVGLLSRFNTWFDRMWKVKVFRIVMYSLAGALIIFITIAIVNKLQERKEQRQLKEQIEKDKRILNEIQALRDSLATKVSESELQTDYYVDRLKGDDAESKKKDSIGLKSKSK